MLERMLPAPLPLPEAWVWAKEQLQASQKPHHCLAHAHPHWEFSPRLRVGEAGAREYLPKAVLLRCGEGKLMGTLAFNQVFIRNIAWGLMESL